MKRKTRNMLIGIGGVVVILAVAAAFVLSAASTSQQSAQTEGEDAQTTEQQTEGEDANTPDWLSKASSNVQLLVAELCSKNWQTATNDAQLSFSKDGTYTLLTGTDNEKTGTWRLDDMKLANSNGDYRECTAVITVDGDPHTFTSYLQSVTAADEHVATVTQYIYTSCFASGNHFAATGKAVDFKLAGIDGELAPYVGDAASFTSQYADWCKTNVPLATSARWMRDLKISYDKQMAQATFTCNDAKQTKTYVTFLLTGGLFKISTSSSM